MSDELTDIYDDGKLDAIRNPDGIWINTQVFREEGNHFMKYGYYCPDPWGSPNWLKYWQEQRNRCIYGYSSGGVKITGDHYGYLNFSPIQRVADTQADTSNKIKGFPDFWDGDYNYFWVRNIARFGIIKATKRIDEQSDDMFTTTNLKDAILAKKLLEDVGLEVKIKENALFGGWDLIVGKSRRKGYSYKNAFIAANNYFHRPHSYTMFMAYEKKYLYPRGIFGMARDVINFINTNTAWVMPSDYVDRSDHIRASYVEYKNGIKLEKGFMSEIQAISFKDNPDAGRGKDCYDIFGEEVGAWGVPGGLKETRVSMEPSVKAGNIKTGMMTFFGTSGDTDKGTVDFADMHSRPEAFEFMPFYDVWGPIKEKVEGFFHPVQWNMEGFYDANGNSDLVGALSAEEKHREYLKEHGATSAELQRRMQEHPTNSAEAFSLISTNNFPIVELKEQLEKVKALKLHKTKGTPVTLYYKDGKCNAKPILDGSADPIYSLKNEKRLNLSGCPIIYEMPVENAPKGLYKIGYDPVRQDTGTSLAGIIVYKSKDRNSLYHNVIVAEYIGRLDTPDDIDHVAEMFADLYNTQIMHENEVTGVKNYFRRIKRLGLLAMQPDMVISKNIKKSTVARVYGCHMIDQLKDAGERYVNQWLRTIVDFDENGDPIRTIDRIFSLRLLEELIAYDRKNGNFDLVSALFMCMFMVQEEELGHEYNSQDQPDSIGNQLKRLRKRMYGGKPQGIAANF